MWLASKNKKSSLIDLIFIAIISIYCGISIFKISGIFIKTSNSDFEPIVLFSSDTTPPVLIEIPNLNKNLKIAPARINGNDWQLYNDKVSWLASSALPGKGNVILYAHDTPNLFGDLYKLEIGNEILIKTSGKSFSYKVKEIKNVNPDDISSIMSIKNRLTLYTCNGIFDQKRLVVYAE